MPTLSVNCKCNYSNVLALPSRKRKKRIQVGMKFTVPLGGYLESYQVLIIMTTCIMVTKVASLLRTEDIATQVCH